MLLGNRCILSCMVFIAASVLLPAVAAASGPILFEFSENFDLTTVTTQDTKLTRNGPALRLVTGTKAAWPGITLKAPQYPRGLGGRWDLSGCGYLLLDLKNVATSGVKVSCRVDNPGADGKKNCVTGTIELGPGEQQTLKVPLSSKIPPDLRGKLFGMRGYPFGWRDEGGIDPAHITQLLLFVAKPTEPHVFEVTNIRAGGEPPLRVALLEQALASARAGREPPAALLTDETKLFPMIDRYGQFIHKDWPGKTKSPDDLAAYKREEAADLAAHPGPSGWDQYGGWQAGPELKASGFFRAQKYQGKWWLVDPEGRLFWSHGSDCVHTSNATTPISDREYWFADLPPKDSPFGQFYGRGRSAAHGYYQGKNYDTFNFTAANLLRKYGPDWKSAAAQLAHRRLRSWGMNTIANWSDPQTYALRKTPYTVNVGGRSVSLAGSEGYWGKFDDVFDPRFSSALRAAIAAEKDRSAADPWCLGYFIGNELSWGNETSLALATLHSPPEQAAKKVFLADLQTKYQTIDRLNQAWGTQHASWGALRESTTPPDVKKARDDLAAFYTKTAEHYFRTCRDAVKQVAPNHLYLGCRFAWTNDLAVRAAAKYCDVISFNRYRRTAADLKLPQGLDKPVVIGEFHFGALDRGMFHTGLVPTASQQERAACYATYVRSALDNPLVVGTHWFQYGDQATTGRSDGENYQIGFLDVCDTPYHETIAASREVADEMYQRRAEKTKP